MGSVGSPTDSTICLSFTLINGCELAAFFPNDAVGEVAADGGGEVLDTVTGGMAVDDQERGPGSHEV